MLLTSHFIITLISICRLSNMMFNSLNMKKIIRPISVYGKRSSSQTAENSNTDRFKEEFTQVNIPISSFQQTLLSIGSAYKALVDPFRADMIATLGETTGNFALENILSQMKNSDEGCQILRDQPRIKSNCIDLIELRKMKEGTLGRCYANFLDDNKVTPDSRDPVRFVNDVQLAYVMTRYREIHDLIHAVLDMKTNMLGEVTVKWVEAIQTKLPMCIGGAVFGPLRLKPKQRRDYLNHYLPWAIETGNYSKFFLNVYFENRWSQPVDELRKELNIKPLILPQDR